MPITHVCCEDSPTKGLYVLFFSPMTSTFIQGHKCVSDFTNVLLVIYPTILLLSYGVQTWHVDLRMAYMFMLVLLTLTLMQGHSGSSEAKISVELSN